MRVITMKHLPASISTPNVALRSSERRSVAFRVNSVHRLVSFISSPYRHAFLPSF